MGSFYYLMIVIFILKYIIHFHFFCNLVSTLLKSKHWSFDFACLCKSTQAQAEANTQLYQIHGVDNGETIKFFIIFSQKWCRHCTPVVKKHTVFSTSNQTRRLSKYLETFKSGTDSNVKEDNYPRISVPLPSLKEYCVFSSEIFWRMDVIFKHVILIFTSICLMAYKD